MAIQDLTLRFLTLRFHDDPYFALTLLVGDELTSLSQAPDAPPIPPTPSQARIDRAMADVTWLRYQGKLDPIMSAVLAE